MYRVAVLITFYNRKERTLQCLKSLYQAVQPAVEFSVYACDDGSTDGTAEAIRIDHPSVKIVPGDGSLFWNRGMLKVWEEAVRQDYDYYLWLNDDTVVDVNFWDEMMSSTQTSAAPVVVSGLIADANTGKIIYGGTGQSGTLIQANAEDRTIKNLNGNMVLVPREIVMKVGLLDSRLHHDLGDVDYGYRVTAAGFHLVATRQATGYGVSNNYCRVRKWNVAMWARFKRLYSPLGADPRLIFYFKKKHFGVLDAIITFVYLHVLNFLPDYFVRFVWRDKYVGS